jgi:hypothetical protein
VRPHELVEGGEGGEVEREKEREGSSPWVTLPKARSFGDVAEGPQLRNRVHLVCFGIEFEHLQDKAIVIKGLPFCVSRPAAPGIFQAPNYFI